MKGELRKIKKTMLIYLKEFESYHSYLNSLIKDNKLEDNEILKKQFF